MILAIVLSALVLIGWSLVSDRLLPTANPPAVKVEDGKAVPLPQPQASPAADTPQANRSRAVVMRETPRVIVDTPSLKGSINLKGARFDDLVLVRQRETIAKDSPPVRLLSPAGAPGAYFAGFGWTGEGVAAPDANSVWTASAPTLTPGKPITLSWANSTGQRFELIVAVDDGYLFTVNQRVTNTGTGAVALRAYGLVSRATQSPDPSGWTMHVGPMGFLDGKANYGIDWETLDEAGPAGEQIDSRGGWLGFTDQYLLTALDPAGDGPLTPTLR